jgi:DNA-binding SARP family transcriptional activator
LPVDGQADLSVRFLGVFRLFKKGKTLDVPPGPRLRSLLAYLLCHACQKRVHRDQVIRAFWPDHGASDGRNCLHVSISNLRRYLKKHFGETEIIVFREESLFINPAIKIWKDTDIFNSYLEEAKNLAQTGKKEAAAAPYSRAATTEFGSAFLEDMQEEAWTLHLREALSAKYLKANYFLADLHLEKGRCDEARELLRPLLSKDDCAEATHYRIIKSYVEEGCWNDAQRAYQECAQTLKQRLNAEPSAAIKGLMQQRQRG